MEQKFTLPTFDGQVLSARVFQTQQAQKGVILIGSALATPQHFYAAYAIYLAENGYTTYTFDYRGTGESRPASLKGYAAYMSEWGQLDLDAMIPYIKERHPKLPLYLIGHSAGGQVIGLTPESRHIDKMVLAPSGVGYYGAWPFWQRPIGLFISYLGIPIPSAIFDYFPGKKLGIFKKDLPKGVATEWAKWCRSKDYCYSFHSQQYISKMKIPILAYSFSDDTSGPKKAIEQLLSYYTAATIEHRHFTPSDLGTKKVGHFGFFKKRMEDALWKPTLDWLEVPIHEGVH